MDMNAAFMMDTFEAALKWADASEDYADKPIVIVFDNAGCHERAEDLVLERVLENPSLPANRLYLLRLGPYSPMCNPIEGCFSVLKAYVKTYMAEHRERLLRATTRESIEGRKRALLVEAANYAMPVLTSTLVREQELHSAFWWGKARRLEDMQLGA
ncbi:hypothetical protein ATCC90586_010930 [Pythium insidiosum]|nr:hypothetical protein ATCC90586_010930 [Pythium insidiosum]